MQVLPSSILQEMLKLASSGSVLFLLSVPYHNIYWARNTRDVSWNGRTYTRSWFDLGVIRGSGESSLPDMVVSVSNVGRMVENEVVRRSAFRGVEVNLYIVNSNCLAESIPLYWMVFHALKCTCKTDVVDFTLGTENVLLMAFPAWASHGSLCQYREFKGSLCGYSGYDYTDCDRTHVSCLIRQGNLWRFGANLGMMGEIYEETA